MPAPSVFKRDVPSKDFDPRGSVRQSRLPFVVFLVTHGLWLATSLAGLILALGDARSEPGFVAMARLVVGH